MGLKFNPLTSTFDLVGSGGGGGSAFFAGEVATYADLPLDGTAALNSRWLVRSNSGTWPFSSYKQAGVYVRKAIVGASRDNDYQLTDTSFHDVMSDDAFLLYDNGDSSKNLAFELSGISTGTTRTLTAPDASGTLALTTSRVSSANALYDTFANIDAVTVTEGNLVIRTLAVNDYLAVINTESITANRSFTLPDRSGVNVVSDTGAGSGSDVVNNIVSLTQAEYNAIGSPDAATLFLITDP
jgi:hypothetical protein